MAESLGYTSTNMVQIVYNVPEEWKGSNPVATPSGIQDMVVLSEPCLYFFLGRSAKPLALPFQKWIAADVIPAIRKIGFYAVQSQEAALLASIEKIDIKKFADSSLEFSESFFYSAKILYKSFLNFFNITPEDLSIQSFGDYFMATFKDLKPEHEKISGKMQQVFGGVKRKKEAANG